MTMATNGESVDSEETGYKTLSSHITERKKIEFEARKRVEERGGTIITSSTAIVTIVFSITALLTGTKDDVEVLQRGTASILLIASLLVFVIAIAIGIFVQNKPLAYRAAKESTLLTFPGSARWSASEMEAARLCAWIDIDGISSLQRGTRVKALLLTAGLSAQALAVLLLVSALAFDLHARGLF